MKTIPLKISAKSRLTRWFAYFCLAATFGAVSIFIAMDANKDYKASGGAGELSLCIIIGIALPFIFVIGEMIRFRMWCSKIPAVMCYDCAHTFEIKELCRTGKCPECESKRVVGIKPDDDGPAVSLYD